MESEHSNTGINLDRHWRAALGWFSYTLTDKAREAGALLITYNGSDAGKSFSILVNDKLNANDALNGNRSNLLYTKQYVIPEDIRRSSKGSLIVKFKATGGKATGCIYEMELTVKHPHPVCG
ncbi:hypothetical protein MTO98_25530 [Mucilaginibacter sp. SMC90]|uniref:DUF6805 domain-containing protein n=1 Tax=Mucilaginibacter sp. SMC90 TaxID=2929803 RepID=UPI001FB2A3FD|nr:DUF6805 domain-containing protein [Mucilaginibacter sp. SMC90]UOE47775.1 hypothetical protein MTO98_25530 [Mucilaginibacter sp. SMC90]